MKIIFSICLLLFLFSCQEKKEIFKAPKVKDINKVIEAVLYKDRLSVFKGDTSNTNICIRLNKIDVKVMPSKKEGELIAPEPPGNYVYVQQLLYSSEKSPAFFSKSDSTYLLYQNDVHKSLNIDLAFSKKLNTISFEESQTDKQGWDKRYYSISVPIFSKDGNTAYVELNYYAGDFGNGFAIILKKEKGVWKIIQSRLSWIS